MKDYSKGNPDHYSKTKGAWGFKCGDCGHEYSNCAGGCDGCRVCAKCGKSGGCLNMISWQDGLTAEVVGMSGLGEGHDEPCYYCKGRCDNLAGSPGEWAVALCHSDDPGVVKWHHTKCVSERLERLERLESNDS